MSRRALSYFVSGLAVAAGVASAGLWLSSPALDGLPQVVRLPAQDLIFRPGGDFRIGTRVVDAPPVISRAGAGLEIMKYPVSQADYGRCIADGACKTSTQGAPDRPQVDVSFHDAEAYAGWLSRTTGQTWRLPTDDEWVRAAADRIADAQLGQAASGADPSKRWIARYRSEVDLRGLADTVLRPRGGFGENSLGVADIAGNVWEWTSSCFTNGRVSEDGSRLLDSTEYCGVRVAQGKHRAFMIEFVRDAKSGGCAVGVPPDYLGFRLLRDRTDA